MKKSCFIGVRGWRLNVRLALFLLPTVSAPAGVHYVDVNSTNATLPYTNWTTAATNIQDAVDAAVAGDEVVVTNGVYATGIRRGFRVSRVLVAKPLNVRSVNGPTLTAIDGGGSVPCATLTNGASLTGFTLQNGFAEDYGGGAYGGTLNNCTLTGNRALGSLRYDGNTYQFSDAYGGGAYACTLNNCTLASNSVQAPYIYVSYYDIEAGGRAGGGGAYACTLNNCRLSGNLAETPFSGSVIIYNGINSQFSGSYGGGANSCTLNNCTLTTNAALGYSGYLDFGYGPTYVEIYGFGGGAFECTLNNCTLTGNSYYNGGCCTISNTLNNCILFSNSDYDDFGSPGALAGNNWFGDPLFVDSSGWANLRLQPNSPCINAGNNSYVTNTTDLDGNPRISGGTVDIGAYEFQLPRLTITSSGTNVILSWPITNAGYSSTGFYLQETRNLGSPDGWATADPFLPIIVNGQYKVTRPMLGPQISFRFSR